MRSVPIATPTTTSKSTLPLRTWGQCCIFNHMNKLILIRGLPGSGKSTLAKKYVADHGFVHVEADMYFIDHVGTGQYIFNPSKIKDAHRWCQESARVYLANGYNVVVSNTFTQLWEMEPYIKMAELAGATIKIIETTGKFQNVHGVPQETIARMAARWEPITESHGLIAYNEPVPTAIA